MTSVPFTGDVLPTSVFDLVGHKGMMSRDLRLQTGDLLVDTEGNVLLVGDLNASGGTCNCCDTKNFIVQQVRNSWLVWEADE